MTAHPATELLSAYLDRELEASASRAVEEHVEVCGGCQHRLDGLRRVVERLHDAPAATPPNGLERAIERRVARLTGSREARTIERRSENVFHPAVGVGFAVVMALAVVILLFSQSLSRRPVAAPQVIVPRAEGGLPEGQVVRVSDRSFVLAGGVLWQSGIEHTTILPPPFPPARLRAFVDEHAWLEELLGLGRPVVLELSGALGTVRPDDLPAGG